MYVCSDILHMERTSSGMARERIKCDVNRVLIGMVSVFSSDSTYNINLMLTNINVHSELKKKFAWRQ